VASTYEPIASQTLGSAASSVSFTSIAADWTDLICVVQGTASADGADVIMQFNTDTASNYSQTVLRGNGSTAVSARYTTQYLNSANTWGPSRLYTHFVQIMSYANTNIFKTSLTATAYAGGDVARIVNLWRSTSAITSIELKTASFTFAANTTFSLYGIKAA